ncbi:hypothetical protein V2J09_008362 [Rumex salicifolius]
MEMRRRKYFKVWFLLLGLLASATLWPRCDARKTTISSKDSFLRSKHPKKLKTHKHLSIKDISNTQPYVSSPFSWPPFDSLPTDNSPPTGPIANPGPPVFGLSPPFFEQSPPGPSIYNPAPPAIFVPSPVIFQPPVIYPPPIGPPPRTIMALWCVVKPSVPDPIIQEAMNYACGMGADCGPLQPNGLCFEPNTLIAHASFAFNSYWQRTKVAGGTCSFGGTAILVTMDPSHSGCHFDYF